MTTRHYFGAVLFVLIVAVSALSACGPSPRTSSVPPTLSSPDSAPRSTTDPTLIPVGVDIPAINAASSLIRLGLDADGAPIVPGLDRPQQAGWLRVDHQSSGPTPLDPVIVLAHVDAHQEFGLFHDLKSLKAGQEIRVKMADGSTWVYTVTRVDKIAKTQFPTSVYDATETPELRAITCGGTFDRSKRSYKDNIVAFAKRSSIEPKGA